MKKTRNAVIMSALLSTALLSGVLFHLNGYDFQLAAGVKGKNTSATTTSASLDFIDLSFYPKR